MLTGMRKRKNTYSLLIQVPTDLAPLKISADVPQKAIDRTFTESSYTNHFWVYRQETPTIEILVHVLLLLSLQ